MPDAPFQLTGFEPISRIGSGGFGEVWLARQANIDRKVAIKVGHSPIDDKTVQLRFERECIALGRLSGHPNIIDVFTAGQLDDGRPYLVLEFVNGGTLWQRLQRGPLSEPELCRVGIQLCDALAVAHEAGVLHRDLKPENVLLRQNGEAVLGDFGIARLHDGANTTSHAITASVAYAAPEILSGSPASVASDLYGIGICLLASTLRSVPFVEKTDESIHSIINRVLNNQPPDLHRHFGLSEALDSTIAMLLDRSGLRGDLERRLAEGMPVLGTCAGMIMLATEVVDGRPDQRSLDAIDLVVRRNAFGRQVDSFEAPVDVEGLDGGPFPGVFIRAPWVESVGPEVEVLATQYCKVLTLGEPILLPADEMTRVLKRFKKYGQRAQD